MKSTTKKRYDLVKQILEDYPDTRDSQAKLLKRCYHAEHGSQVHLWTFDMFLLRLTEKTIGKPDTFIRYSRSLKAKFPNLRGASWQDDQTMQEEVIHEQTILK